MLTVKRNERNNDIKSISPTSRHKFFSFFAIRANGWASKCFVYCEIQVVDHKFTVAYTKHTHTHNERAPAPSLITFWCFCFFNFNTQSMCSHTIACITHKHTLHQLCDCVNVSCSLFCWRKKTFLQFYWSSLLRFVSRPHHTHTHTLFSVFSTWPSVANRLAKKIYFSLSLGCSRIHWLCRHLVASSLRPAVWIYIHICACALSVVRMFV